MLYLFQTFFKGALYVTTKHGLSIIGAHLVALIGNLLIFQILPVGRLSLGLATVISVLAMIAAGFSERQLVIANAIEEPSCRPTTTGFLGTNRYRWRFGRSACGFMARNIFIQNTANQQPDSSAAVQYGN